MGRGFWVRVSGSGLLGHFTQNTPDDTYRNTLERSNSERLMVWVWRFWFAAGLLVMLKKLPHFWVSRIGAAFLVQLPPEQALLSKLGCSVTTPERVLRRSALFAWRPVFVLARHRHREHHRRACSAEGPDQQCVAWTRIRTRNEIRRTRNRVVGERAVCQLIKGHCA